MLGFILLIDFFLFSFPGYGERGLSLCCRLHPVTGSSGPFLLRGRGAVMVCPFAGHVSPSFKGHVVLCLLSLTCRLEAPGPTDAGSGALDQRPRGRAGASRKEPATAAWTLQTAAAGAGGVLKTPPPTRKF